MKKLSLLLSFLILFGGMSFAVQQKADKTEKKEDKKEVKKVPAKKKTTETKKDTKAAK